MLSKDRLIRYLNRDFDSILRKLVDYTKYYYPESYNDFSPASPAMIFLELIAYTGDVLNFYLDKQTKLSILTTATQRLSIYNIAQSFGYQIKTAKPSSVLLTVLCVVPAIEGQQAPDFKYAPIIYPGMQVTAKLYPSSIFTVLLTINFKDGSDLTVLPTLISDDTNLFFILRKTLYAYSVVYNIYRHKCSEDVENNLKIYLPKKLILKIVLVKDLYGRLWYQVDNLSDDSVISSLVKYINNIRLFKRIKTNKRFKKYVDSLGKTYLYFGSKLPTNNSGNNDRYKTFYNFIHGLIDSPNKLLSSNTYGEVPTDTLITIKYLTSSQSQVPSNSIETIVKLEHYNLDIQTSELQDRYNLIMKVLNVTNTVPSVGGSGVLSLLSIKKNALSLIGSQGRLVTLLDYNNAVRIMPPEYGSVEKSYIQKNPLTNNILIFVLSYDFLKHLTQTPSQIKVNMGLFMLKYRMMGLYIVLKDAQIINVGCLFDIAVLVGYFKRLVLFNVLNVVKLYMNILNFEIGTPIDKNILRNKMLSVPGVINVPKLYFFNKFSGSLLGRSYSKIVYNMDNALRDLKYFTSYTPSIFLLKYPLKDIVGSVIN